MDKVNHSMAGSQATFGGKPRMTTATAGLEAARLDGDIEAIRTQVSNLNKLRRAKEAERGKMLMLAATLAARRAK